MPPFILKRKEVFTMENGSKIIYDGIEYNLVFNLNVMEEIQTEYGSVEAWGKLTDAETEPNAKAIKFGLGAMLNEGIDIYNESHEDKRELLSLKKVGRIITEVGLENIANQINNTVVDSTKSDEKN